MISSPLEPPSRTLHTYTKHIVPHIQYTEFTVTDGRIGCTVSHIRSVKCAFVLSLPCRGSWCTVNLCSALPM
jgi:hypothetical protein